MEHQGLWRWGDPVAELRRCVDDGGVVGIPTESSYGLGVDPRSEIAVRRVFEAKGRAPDQPLGVVVAGAAQAEALGVDVASPAFQAAASYWPAALNVLVEVREPLPAMCGASLLSVRIPEHPRLRALLGELGTGLTATSANVSGEPPLLEPSELTAMLLRARVPHRVVDDGQQPGGEPSTMVIWRDGSFQVLRAGRTTI